MNKKISIEQARKVLAVVDMGLVNGLGSPEPGRMCVEAAVCFALGEPHSDEPSCVAASVRRFKIWLNDSQWSSDVARTAGMRKLAIAQLGSKDNVDEVAFSKILSAFTIQRVLPPMLRRVDLTAQAARCELEGSEASARAAKAAASASHAAHAAASAAHAAAYAAYAYAAHAYAAASAAHAYAAASAAYAAHAAASAAYAATYAADLNFRDEILNISAGCCLDALREVNAPGIALLDELGI